MSVQSTETITTRHLGCGYTTVFDFNYAEEQGRALGILEVNWTTICTVQCIACQLTQQLDDSIWLL